MRRGDLSGEMRGSLTVEAAFSVPITFYAIMIFLYLFIAMQVELEVAQKVHTFVSTLQRYGAAYELLRNRVDSADDETLLSELGFDTWIGSTVDSVYLSNRIGKMMGDSEYLSRVVHGKEGFDCTGSSLFSEEGMIDLQVRYVIRMPYSVFGIGNRKVTLRIRAKAFCGANTQDRVIVLPSSDDTTEEGVVYVTQSGEVYHLDSRCAYLRTSLRKVLRSGIDKERSKDGSIYYPCSECGDGNSVYVYIASWGIRYHSDSECKDLYHNYETIGVSEARRKGLRACSRCTKKAASEQE